MTEEQIETPAWLTAMADQRLALMEGELGPAVAGLIGYSVVMTPLTEPPDDASEELFERWERSCDRCQRFVPKGDNFFTGTMTRDLSGTQVIISFGMCPECREAR